MSNAPRHPPGSTIAGKYRVEREIGSGGMGVVLEATHVALGQRVAVKVLNAEHAGSEENVARFLREARVAATLPSEHIAHVTDVGLAENGTPYLVMELLVGHDLATEVARRGRLPTAEAVDWILEACEGLADAHAAGIVHRDLKPANLFLARRPGRPPILKVLDFGLTKVIGKDRPALTQVGSVFGTPQYMSPEQVLATDDVDARSDQHALAMILFELLTGRPPYQSGAMSRLFVMIVTTEPPSARALAPDVPAGLDRAIARALAKRPDQRFPTLAELAEAIAPFGGQLARSRAESVRRAMAPALAGAVSDAPWPRPSDTDLTSSMDPTRRRTKRMAVLGVATVAIGIAVGAVLARTAAVTMEGTLTPPATSAGIAAPAALPRPAAIPEPPAPALSATNAPDVWPSDTALPESRAKAPSDTSSVRTPAGRPPPGTPRSSNVKRALGVFGDRR